VVRHLTLVNSSASLTTLVDERSVLLSPRRVVPPVKLSVGSRSFLVAAAQLWNSLPDDIVLADSLWTFRLQLKHYLFQQSYVVL